MKFINPFKMNKKLFRSEVNTPFSVDSDNPLKKLGLYGGEITNRSDIKWAISGNKSNNIDKFTWLNPGQNSDKLKQVNEKFNGDTDALWPLGIPLHLGSLNGNIVTSGAVKISDNQNADIYGNSKTGYFIKDYTRHFEEDNLPKGWIIPNKNDIKQ